MLRVKVFTDRIARALVLLAAMPVSQAAWALDMPSFDCIVEPEMLIDLSSAVNGVVRNVSVDRSDSVRAGQVLATLVSRVEEAELALAEIRASLDEEIEAARVQNDLAQSKKERVLELFSKQSIPGFEKDEAIAEASLAALALKQASNNQRLAEMALERARADLELRSVKSPINGVVVDRFVNPGESVNDRPLFKLAQIDPMRVEIIAYSEHFGLVRPGMQAEVIIEGPTETRHLAKVSIVDNVVDAASGTFGIRLSLPNPDNKVVGGLKCRAEFPAAD
ncbi:MAG: efflux RND transporter periplasmic adaptor subunit [Congregibacter sp.]